MLFCPAGTDEDVEGTVRTFLARPSCREHLGLVKGKSYLIMGKSVDLPKLGGRYVSTVCLHNSRICLRFMRLKSVECCAWLNDVTIFLVETCAKFCFMLLKYIFIHLLFFFLFCLADMLDFYFEQTYLLKSGVNIFQKRMKQI